MHFIKNKQSTNATEHVLHVTPTSQRSWGNTLAPLLAGDGITQAFISILTSSFLIFDIIYTINKLHRVSNHTRPLDGAPSLRTLHLGLFVLWDNISVLTYFLSRQKVKQMYQQRSNWLNWLIYWLINSSSSSPSGPCLLPPVPMDRRSSSVSESLHACCWWFWTEMLLSGNTVSQSILPVT